MIYDCRNVLILQNMRFFRTEDALLAHILISLGSFVWLCFKYIRL